MGLTAHPVRQRSQTSNHPGIAPAQLSEFLRIQPRLLIVETPLRIVHFVERPARNIAGQITVRVEMAREGQYPLRRAMNVVRILAIAHPARRAVALEELLGVKREAVCILRLPLKVASSLHVPRKSVENETGVVVVVTNW